MKKGLGFVYILSICLVVNSHIQADDTIVSKSSYPEIGVMLGTPGGINGAIGFWHNRTGFRISGGYTRERLYGYQATFGYILSDSKYSRHTFVFNTSYTSASCVDYYYVGPGYNYNYKWFFLETSLNFGEWNDEYSNPQLGIQIGYMHRFN